jgi:hypothetical protein
MSEYETWAIRLAALALAINVVAAIVIVMQLRLAANNTREATTQRAQEYDLRRKEATMLFQINTLPGRENHESGLPPDRDSVGIARYIEAAANDAGKYSNIRNYLSYLEMMATGVNVGTLDMRVINHFGGGALIAAAANYRSWILQERSRWDAPKLYEELEALASKLAELRAQKEQ